VVFSVSRVNISKRSVKANFIDTWQSFMIKELLEKMFNCVAVFHPNPAVKKTNVIKQEFVLTVFFLSYQMYFYRHEIKNF
jgi:hypothetical protein